MPLTDSSARPALEAGDPVPRWTLEVHNGATMKSSLLDGGPYILVLLASTTPEDNLRVVKLLEAERERIEAADIPVVYVLFGQPHHLEQVRATAGAETITCIDPESAVVNKGFGVPVPGATSRPQLRVVDRNLRLVTVCSDAAAEGEVARVVEGAIALAQPQKEMRGTVAGQAPVLFIPRVLSREQCDALIKMYDTRPTPPLSPVSRTINGKGAFVVDRELKLRRDLHLNAEERDLWGKVIFPRIQPEMKKVFQFSFSYHDGLKIGCYEASDEGHFARHRDNLNYRNAHWRFAMSLNLNEGYEGGCVQFPEYDDTLYRPEPGAALIFSCSLLHEATPVTKGRRFVLLSFFYTAEDSKQGMKVNNYGGYKIAH
jgi:hypothetical protein